MISFHKLRLRFRALFQKQKLDAQMDDEMRSHIEMQTQENINSGMHPDEARYAAQRQFGWVESIKETCRDQRGVSWIENLGQDLRYGARQMLKNPGFTTVAVLTLALGIGANTVIFGFANAILFRPPPFPEPDGLYYLHTRNPLREIGGISGPDLMDWQEQTHAFSRMAAFSEGEFNLRAGEYSSVTSSVSLSNGFLDLFGVRPVLGRSFSDEEYTNSPSLVVMVGDRLWKRSLNQDPAIVGKVIFLDGQGYTIIGVLPKAVASLGDAWESAVSPDVCLPLNLNDSYLRDRSQRSLRVIARLKSGVTREEAEGEAVVIGSRLAEQYPEANRGHSLLINRWDQERQGSWKYWLFFMGMVGCVLLIACANVANLLLARALTRGKEIGIRTALGAQRSRIVRQLLTESLLLALTGGALGILLSRWAMHVLVARFLVMFFGAAAASVEPVLDWRVLAFFLGTSVVAALLFGLIPALQISRVDVNRALQEGNQRTGNRRQCRISRGLVTAEVAITLILLISAATLIDAFMFNLRERTNPGFETAHLAYVRLAMLGPKYESQEQRIALLNLLTERLKTTPGIESVTIGSTLPKGSAFMVRPYATDRLPTSPGETLGASCVQADPRYFQMFNITALRGRLFTDRDRAGSQPVAIINEELAGRLFGTNDPLGQRVTLPGPNPTHYEVIGVVRYKGEGYRWTIFVPIAQRCWVYPTVVIRTTSSTKASLQKLREELRATAPDQPTDSISTMDTMLRKGGLGSERGLLLLFNSFAGAGFFLAIVGIGSIVAYAASQRKREIGVRLALGATRRQILTLMLCEAIVPVAVGLGVGIVVNLAVQRVLWSQVSIGGGWEPNTPLIFALVIGAFSLVALLSSSFPAHRATRIDPMEALRHE